MHLGAAPYEWDAEMQAAARVRCRLETARRLAQEVAGTTSEEMVLAVFDQLRTEAELGYEPPGSTH